MMEFGYAWVRPPLMSGVRWAMLKDGHSSTINTLVRLCWSPWRNPSHWWRRSLKKQSGKIFMMLSNQKSHQREVMLKIFNDILFVWDLCFRFLHCVWEKFLHEWLISILYSIDCLKYTELSDCLSCMLFLVPLNVIFPIWRNCIKQSLSYLTRNFFP